VSGAATHQIKVGCRQHRHRDPGVGELAADRRSDGARALVTGQRKIFDELKLRLGGRGLRVLLVEDNMTSQKVSVWSLKLTALTVQVITKYLEKINVGVETALDGEQCTNMVFAKPHGYFCMILVCSSLSQEYG